MLVCIPLPSILLPLLSTHLLFVAQFTLLCTCTGDLCHWPWEALPLPLPLSPLFPLSCTLVNVSGPERSASREERTFYCSVLSEQTRMLRANRRRFSAYTFTDSKMSSPRRSWNIKRWRFPSGVCGSTRQPITRTSQGSRREARFVQGTSLFGLCAVCVVSVSLPVVKV